MFTHSKHLLIKSRKLASLVLMACAKSLLPGRRFFPLLLVIQRGWPLESETPQSMILPLFICNIYLSYQNNHLNINVVILISMLIIHHQTSNAIVWF